MEVVENVDFDEPLGYKIVQKREKQIIEMIPEEKMKQEIAYLFRKMAAMPASRRMSIMPGVRFTDEPGKVSLKVLICLTVLTRKKIFNRKEIRHHL